MNKIEVFTTSACPYCVKAKKLLQTLNLEYTEHEVDDDFDGMCEELSTTFGKQVQTVPQIIINGHYVGGYSDLEALHKSGKLSSLLR